METNWISDKAENKRTDEYSTDSTKQPSFYEK